MKKPPAALVVALDSKEKGATDEEDDASDGAEADAGKELAAAVKSGDGQRIYDAFATLKALCEEA